MLVAIPVSFSSRGEFEFSPLFGKVEQVLIIDSTKLENQDIKILPNQENNGKTLALAIIQEKCHAVLTHHLGTQAYLNFQNSTVKPYYVNDIKLSISEILERFNQNSFSIFTEEQVHPSKKRNLTCCSEINNIDTTKNLNQNTSKIAVPTKDGVVDDHFGHCEYYTIFETNKNDIISQCTLPAPQGCGCKSNIASILQEAGVTVMLAGNMGLGALNVLSKHGIKTYRGCTGNVENIIKEFLMGHINDSGVSCSHHDGGEHSCQNH